MLFFGILSCVDFEIESEKLDNWDPEEACTQHPCLSEYPNDAQSCCESVEGRDPTLSASWPEHDFDSPPLTSRAAICLAQTNHSLFEAEPCTATAAVFSEQPVWTVYGVLAWDCTNNTGYIDTIDSDIHAESGDLVGFTRTHYDLASCE